MTIPRTGALLLVLVCPDPLSTVILLAKKRQSWCPSFFPFSYARAAPVRRLDEKDKIFGGNHPPSWHHYNTRVDSMVLYVDSRLIIPCTNNNCTLSASTSTDYP